MDLIQQLLQVSAKLYKHLSAFPSGEERTEYIDEVNGLLDERGTLVKQLREQNFQYDETDETHVTLYKLDKGIRERLDLLFNEVKADLKNSTIPRNMKSNISIHMRVYRQWMADITTKEIMRIAFYSNPVISKKESLTWHYKILHTTLINKTASTPLPQAN